MKKGKGVRSTIKQIYKNKCYNEGVNLGRRMDKLTQEIHKEFSLEMDKRNKETIAKNLLELTALRKESQFREEFPSFYKFYDYVVNPENGFTLEDLREL